MTPLAMPVAKLLRGYVRPQWEWTYYPASDKACNMETATRLMQLGFKRCWSAFILLSPRGLAHFLELGKQDEDFVFDQDEFRIRCIARGNPYEVAWTMDQVLLAFERWECLQASFEPRRED